MRLIVMFKWYLKDFFTMRLVFGCEMLAVLDFFFSDDSYSVYLEGYCHYYVDPCHDENECDGVPVGYGPSVVEV